MLMFDVAGSSGYSPDDPLLISEQGEVQDGHYFIKVTIAETFPSINISLQANA